MKVRPEHSPPRTARPRRIAVIGAGACGLCMAKTLLASGFDVTVFEMGSQIGGLWCYENDNGRSSAYDTLHINTSRDVTRFHDLDFDAETQAFPDHRDMHRYLERYAAHFGVTPHIRFNTAVRGLSPDFDPAKGEPSRWALTLDGGETETFDAVVAASGHLTEPMHVPMLRDEFTGEYLHSHHYRTPLPYVGKRICIVGVGNSACDISGDVCATATRCVLVARSGVVIVPKLLFGIPFTDITRKLQRPNLPAWLRRKLIGWLVWVAHGDSAKLGFKPLDGKRAHITSNGTIVTDIAYRRVEVKQGIESVSGRTLHFVDGTSDEFDVLIAATGYNIDLSFVSPEIVNIENNRLDLYKRMAVPGWPGLYFGGFFNTDTALNMVYEHQARWVRTLELGDVELPDAARMQADIDAKTRWMADHYRASHRHTLEEEHVPYITELQRSLRDLKAASTTTGAAA